MAATESASLSAQRLQRLKRLLRPLAAAFPFMEPELLAMSVLRFSGETYALKKKNKTLDLFLSFLAVPLICLYLLVRSRQKGRPFPRAQVHLQCGDTAYYKKYLKKIEESLPGIECRKSGVGFGMDYPPISDHFLIQEAVRSAFGYVLSAPYLFILSLFMRLNLVGAFARTCIVYCRGSRYFKTYPTRLFLTYADNSCSPALYSAFKNSGGEFLCAFQNGIRFIDEGIDYSCMDLFFPISQNAVELYHHLGSKIGKSTPVGSLLIANNPQLMTLKPENPCDVMFIDQGFPFNGLHFWGRVGSEVVRPFFDYIRQFAKERQDLRLVYQMRCYEGERPAVVQKILEWFEGTPIEVREGCEALQSYQSIIDAKVVVTMCSTLGLAAPHLERPVIFCNFSDNPDYDVLRSPFQIRAAGYSEFKNVIESTLEGKLNLQMLDIDYYASRNTLQATSIIVEALWERLLTNDTTH